MNSMSHVLRSSFVCLLLVSASALAQQPVISAGGILNAASNALPGLPNSGIAQGSMFVVFGSNLGPAQLTQAGAFPLPTTLAGTSVRVTAGGATTNAIMVYTSAGQVAAIMPSNVPVGTAAVSVTFNNNTSNSVSVRVVPSAFGIFTVNQTGSGPAIVQNFDSQSSTPLNTRLTAVRPGQAVILWGTGLGPVSGNEAAAPQPGDLTNIPTEVFVGNMRAQLLYRGRSGQFAGVDQINFVIPSGVQGCQVPVVVRTGNIVSNFATIAVMPNGGICSEPGGLTPAELSAAQSANGLRLGNVFLTRTSIRTGIPLFPDIRLDSGGADFSRYTFSQFLGSQSIALGLVSVGGCNVLTFRGDVDLTPDDPVRPAALDAGPTITINGPRGTRTLTRQSDGSYSGDLGGGIPGAGGQPDFLDSGNYTFNNGNGGTGANAVGAFTGNYALSAPINWTNEAQVSSINRAEGQRITWTGGDANTTVFIAGSSEDSATNTSAAFFCTERATAGSFTVPASVLLALPVNTGSSVTDLNAVFFVGSIQAPGRFTAPGLDVGIIQALTLIGKPVAFR